MSSIDILLVALFQWIVMKIGLIDKFNFLSERQKLLGKKYEKQLTLVLLFYGCLKLFINHWAVDMLFMSIWITYCIFAVIEVYAYEGVENERKQN